MQGPNILREMELGWSSGLYVLQNCSSCCNTYSLPGNCFPCFMQDVKVSKRNSQIYDIRNTAPYAFNSRDLASARRLLLSPDEGFIVLMCRWKRCDMYQWNVLITVIVVS